MKYKDKKDNISYNIISKMVPSESRVLDLGCGDGSLLKHLIDKKSVKGHGVEIDEDMVIRCLNKGISVVQGNIDEGLKEYPDKSYDFIILNQTLQSIYNIEMLLKEVLRVGKKVIVGVPNFANWRVRYSMFFKGMLPVTESLNYEWYNTPNIRLITIKDFEHICNRLSIKIVQKKFYAGNSNIIGVKKFFPNFFSDNGLFLIDGR